MIGRLVLVVLSSEKLDFYENVQIFKDVATNSGITIDCGFGYNL